MDYRNKIIGRAVGLCHFATKSRPFLEHFQPVIQRVPEALCSRGTAADKWR